MGLTKIIQHRNEGALMNREILYKHIKKSKVKEYEKRIAAGENIDKILFFRSLYDAQYSPNSKYIKWLKDIKNSRYKPENDIERLLIALAVGTLVQIKKYIKKIDVDFLTKQQPVGDIYFYPIKLTIAFERMDIFWYLVKYSGIKNVELIMKKIIMIAIIRNNDSLVQTALALGAESNKYLKRVAKKHNYKKIMKLLQTAR